MTAPPILASANSHPRRTSTESASPSSSPASPRVRRFSNHETPTVYKHAFMSKITLPESGTARLVPAGVPPRPSSPTAPSSPSDPQSTASTPPHNATLKPMARIAGDGVGAALTDTPAPSMPASPRIPVTRNTSNLSTPRSRPTTLDIPGLTKSKVSPDGKIAQRDVGSKLVVVMVGLPARGKSYITKKMTRYLNWLQHDTKIFNVGERRRVAASGHAYRLSSSSLERIPSHVARALEQQRGQSLPERAASILINGPDDRSALDSLSQLDLGSPAHDEGAGTPPRVEVTSPGPGDPTPTNEDAVVDDSIDQSAHFFDPTNTEAALLREQCAMETLDELLDYILDGSGSVGIFDATNSTLARRKQIMERIKARAGPELNVLFVESVCEDKSLLETNMRLKLSGPDYDGTDAVAALQDFKKRVAMYEKNYVPLGDYEEVNHMPYVKMIDVGRKMISHQIRGFLAGQAVYYLLNFNLAPRMIWITRHGESEDNVAGRIGGDSELTPQGRKYAKALTKFIEQQRKEWDIRQADKLAHAHFPPMSGDSTPPNPYYGAMSEAKNFCVWTSMLKRSIHTAQNFNDENYDVKEMKMLDELNAGAMEGLTYAEIQKQHAEEFASRKYDKLAYRYPGQGGEGYLDIINRIRPVIVELERMTDHCLLVTHRSIARVLLAYFCGLKREDVADLDCPLGMLYQIEPRPYGVDFNAWRYNSEHDNFQLMPNYKLRRTAVPFQ